MRESSSILSDMVISKLPSTLFSVCEERGTVKVSKVKGHADQAMVDEVMFGMRTLLATMVLRRLPTWGRFEATG